MCYLDCIKRSLAAFKTGGPPALVDIQAYGFRNQFEFAFTSYLSVPIRIEWRLPLISPFFSSSRHSASVFTVERARRVVKGPGFENQFIH